MSTDSQNLVEVMIEPTAKNKLNSIGFAPVAETGQSAAFRHVETGSLVTLTKKVWSGIDTTGRTFSLSNTGLSHRVWFLMQRSLK